MTDNRIEKIRVEIEKAYNEAQNRVKLVKDVYWEGKVDAYRNVLCVFDLTQEEPAHCTGIGDPKEESGVLGGMIREMKEGPVSEELEEAARRYAGIPEDSHHDLNYCVQDKKAKYDAVLFGAKWQKEQMMKSVLEVADEEKESKV